MGEAEPLAALVQLDTVHWIERLRRTFPRYRRRDKRTVGFVALKERRLGKAITLETKLARTLWKRKDFKTGVMQLSDLGLVWWDRSANVTFPGGPLPNSLYRTFESMR